MKKKTMITSAIGCLTIAPVLSLFTTSCSKQKLSEAHILSINDFHGAAPGFGDRNFELTNANNPGAIRLAQEFEEIRAKHPGTITIACGDLNAGEGFSTCERGDTFYPVCKALGITYSTVGNHAWEWGSEPLENYHYDKLGRTADTIGNYFMTSNVLNGAQYRDKTWCADTSSYQFKIDYDLWKQVRVPWADPFKLVNMNGHNVCLIGLTTKDTLTDGNMEAMKTLSFIDYTAAVNYSKAYAYEVLGSDTYDSIEAFILDTHLDCQYVDDKKPELGLTGEAESLARLINTRVDGVLAAHSHQICNGIVHNDKLNKNIPVAQGGQCARRYVDTKLTFDDSKSEGSRLKSVEMTIKMPNIEGRGSVTEKPDIDKAAAQLQNILDTTQYDVVKNVYEVYKKQRAIALSNLEKIVGTTKKVEFDRTSGKIYGLPYWYAEDKRDFGTNYYQSPTLLEPAGIWANIAMIKAFNEHYKDLIALGYCYPAAVGITNLDSLKSGFWWTEGSTSEKPLIKKDVYQMHAFENAINYGCLTIDQLKQYINYILDGVGEDGTIKFNYAKKTSTPMKFYYEADHSEANEVKWDAKEGTDVVDGYPTKTGTSYVSGLSQFHGMKFQVKKVGTATAEGYSKYQLVDGSLYIWDPIKNPNDMYDPSKWIKAENYDSFGGYVPIIFADFTWTGGNAQNRMIHHWVDYNGKKHALAGHQTFDLYTRNSALEYLEMLLEKEWAINQINDAGDLIDLTYVKSILDIV